MMISPWKVYITLAAFLAAVLSIGALLLADSADRAQVDAYVLGMRAELPQLQDADYATIAVADAALIAGVHHARGDTGRAADIFERLDALDRLDAEGLRTLAEFQGEAGDFVARHLTLARLIEHDAAQGGLTDAEIRSVLGYFDAMGMADKRLALLERLDAAGKTTAEDRVQLMRIYRHNGRADDALRVLRTLLASDVADTGVNDMRTLVRLMIRSGQEAEVPALLENWIQAPRPRAETRRRLALLAELEQPDLVIRHAAPWRQADETMSRLFDYALYTLRDDPEYAEGYTNRLLERLAEPVGDDADVMPMLHEVFDRLPLDEAYARLSATVPGDNGVLSEIYLNRLVQAGRVDEAGAILFAALEEGPEDFAAQTASAERLIAIGDYARAEIAYRRIAERHGPNKVTMNGLRYAWMRQGKPEDLDWVGQQLLASSGGRYDRWEAEFKATAQPTILLNWLQKQAPADTLETKIARTRVTLALWEPSAPRLERELQAALAVRQLTATDADRYLTAACENGHASAASIALESYETLAGAHADGRLCIARLTPEDAPSRLIVYRYRAAADAAADFTAMDTLRFANATRDALGTRAATGLYRTALDQLPPLETATLEQALLRGYVEMDLGNQIRAATAFEQVLARPEGARSLRQTGTDEAALLKLLLQIYTDLGDYDAVLRLTADYRGSGYLPIRNASSSTLD